MNIRAIGFIGALVLAAPVLAAPAVAAPANGVSAHTYVNLTSAAPASTGAAVAPGESTAKVENVWWRRGYGFRGPYRGYAFRRPFFGGYYGWRRPYLGYYAWRRPGWRGRWVY